MSDTEHDSRLYPEEPNDQPGQETHSKAKLTEAQAKVAKADQLRVETLQAMLSTPAGRALLAWVLFELCGFTQSTVSASPTAEGLHASNLFRAGQRDVALKLHQVLRRADSSGYIVLLREHLDEM